MSENRRGFLTHTVDLNFVTLDTFIQRCALIR